MQRRLTATLAVLFTLALGLSLTRAQDQPEPAQVMGKDGDTLTPLSLGNTWVYECKDNQTTTTDRIEGVLSFDDKPWYLMRMYERAMDEPDAKPEMINEYVLTHNKGVESDAGLEINEDTGQLQLAYINNYFRYPATLGETYQPDSDQPEVQVKVIEINKTIKTPAGEFTCVVYRETVVGEEGFSHTSYVCPGVGVVRYIDVFEDETLTSDLVKLTLVEKPE